MSGNGVPTGQRCHTPAFNAGLEVCSRLIARGDPIAEEQPMVEPRQERFYDVAEVARLLRVSPSTVRRWIAAGTLVAHRVGPRAIRIRKEELERIIQPARAGRTEAAQASGEALLASRPTREELARRQALVKEILELRAKRVITPMTSADLVRKVREEERRSYGRPRRTS